MWEKYRNSSMDAVGLAEKDTSCISIEFKSLNLPGAGQRGGETEGRRSLRMRVCQLGKQAGVGAELPSRRLELPAPAAAMAVAVAAVAVGAEQAAGLTCGGGTVEGAGLWSGDLSFQPPQGGLKRRGRVSGRRGQWEAEEGMAGAGSSREGGEGVEGQGHEAGGEHGWLSPGEFGEFSGGGGERTRGRWRCCRCVPHTAHEPTPTHTTHTLRAQRCLERRGAVTARRKEGGQGKEGQQKEFCGKGRDAERGSSFQ